MKRYFNDPEYRQELLNRGKSFYRIFKYFFFAGLLVFLILLGVYVKYIIDGLPSLEELENPKPELATKVYSYDGEVLGKFFLTKNRSYVSYDEIPPHIISALIATEDKDFYEHWGVTPWRFLRALVKNVLALRLKEGASTITQQLARNLYGLQGSNESPFDKMTRKFREFFTSVQIEKNFTKREILEMYLNTVYFGRGAYGIAAAATVFFNKSTQELTPAEGTLLVGIINGPAYFDPIRHADRSLARRDIVLGQMVKYGKLTQADVDEIKKQPLQFTIDEADGIFGIAPHFVEYIRQQMREKAEKYGFNIYKDGLSIYTTLDSRLQRYANRAVEEHLAEKQPQFNQLWDWNKNIAVLNRGVDRMARQTKMYLRAESAAERDSILAALKSDQHFIDSVKQVMENIEIGFIVIDPHSGGIRAMVGGRNFRSFRYGLNHTTQIRRQPGSAFKPFVYTVAIDNGYPPTYEILNQPVTLMMPDGTRWTPSNFEGDVGGKYTLREGLRNSVNLVAIRMITDGISPKEQVVEYAKKMGINSPIPPYESIALGTAQVTPLEITSAFGVFANEGVRVDPYSIMKIEDKDGNVIEENVPEKREVLSKETSYIMTSLLEDVVNRGSGMRVRNYFHYPAAGKTGTTQDYADAWFVGFTPDLVAGAWVGFDDQAVSFNSADGQGGRAAAPLWGRFMQYVYNDGTIPLPTRYFRQPNGVERDSVCTLSHKLATEFCPEKYEEVFNSKYLPPKCDIHTSSDTTDVGSPIQF
ncbi:MAG: PBP1A family penicillin-binding protein [Bacteroidetes bacterium]|nr:PBP1A family penicillin-binding protein [Bacteroidota bacterium]